MTQKIVQLDMFGADREQPEFKKTVTKAIRGLFARYNDMEYVTLEQQKRIERLEEVLFKDG